MNKFSLESHPKITSGFTAPENYFDNLPDIILEKIKEEQPKKGKVISLKNLSYAAAAILVLALSIPFFTSTANISLEQIDTTTLENYISYQSNVSQYELINLMNENELEAMSVNLGIEDQAIEEILMSNPNFENYITD
ncbi:hypothetical protein FLAN108750_12680 [Flavobacterium antarcticum]|uniref:hypothetical protein n=1 Tax=Flavobacterium antarcticum TaxID=271155 RepID=UPI0003B6BAD7|nr:hypothetical protein [Flavobacterium antarcticum]